MDTGSGERAYDVGAVALATPALPPAKTLKAAQRKARTLITQAKQLEHGERKCKGKVKLRVDQRAPHGPDNPYLRNEDGTIQTRPCKNTSITGGTVCWKHGGKAPQVKKKAERRLLALVEPSIIRLEALVHQDEHLPTALGAVKTILERAGNTPIGPLKDAGDKDVRPVINIGIKVGGIDTPAVVQVAAIEGEVDGA